MSSWFVLCVTSFFSTKIVLTVILLVLRSKMLLKSTYILIVLFLYDTKDLVKLILEIFIFFMKNKNDDTEIIW